MIGQTNRQISKQRLELTVVFRQLVNIDFTWLNFFFFFSFAYFIQSLILGKLVKKVARFEFEKCGLKLVYFVRGGRREGHVQISHVRGF